MSKGLNQSQNVLKYLGLAVWIGGFLLVGILAKVTGKPEAIIGVGGRVWFSACAVLSVLYLATQWFNPQRDLADRSSNESWLVLLLNGMLVMACFVWFME